MTRISILLAALLGMSAFAQPSTTFVDSSGQKLQLATDRAQTLYIGPNGSNESACKLPTQPCATIAGAISKLPKKWRHTQTISVAAGTYAANAGGIIDGYVCETTPGSDATTSPGQLLIVGSQATQTSSTLTAYSAPSSGAPGTATNSGATWTVNAYRGMLLEIGGNRRVILSNTATVITFAGATFSGSPTNGTAYKVVSPGPVVQMTSPLVLRNILSPHVPGETLSPSDLSAPTPSSACVVLQDVTLSNTSTSANKDTLVLDHVDGVALVNARILGAASTNASALKVLDSVGVAQASFMTASGTTGAAASFWGSFRWGHSVDSFYRGTSGVVFNGYGSFTGNSSYEALGTGGKAVWFAPSANVRFDALGTYACASAYDSTSYAIYAQEGASPSIRSAVSTSLPFQISNCYNGVWLEGPRAFMVTTTGTLKTLAVTQVLKILYGAKVDSPSTYSVGTSADAGTATEVIIDGASWTLAAASGKVFGSGVDAGLADYGSWVKH